MRRKSIRPVTLRRIIEVINLSLSHGKVESELLSNTLNIRKRRAKELLSELRDMNLLKEEEGFFLPTENSKRLIEFFEKEDWKSFHDLLVKNNFFYRLFTEAVFKNLGLTKDEILNLLSSSSDLHFNRATIDILCDWAERLGCIQRNLYNGHYYAIEEKSIDLREFAKALSEKYSELNLEVKPGMRLEYIEVARLREEVCEHLKMRREEFDKILIKLIQEFTGKIELCGAPITTTAKKSPTSLKVIERVGKEPILSLKYKVLKEGKGVELNGKIYHYIAIFDDITT
ncbi:MAG: hypothetical protein ACTSV7_03360 [Candidatus Baldrarchaeia archaeon]